MQRPLIKSIFLLTIVYLLLTFALARRGGGASRGGSSSSSRGGGASSSRSGGVGGSGSSYTRGGNAGLIRPIPVPRGHTPGSSAPHGFSFKWLYAGVSLLVHVSFLQLII